MFIDKNFFKNDVRFIFDLDDTLINSMEIFVDLINSDPELSKIVEEKANNKVKLKNGKIVLFPILEENVSSFSFFLEILKTGNKELDNKNLNKLFGNKDMYLNRVKPSPKAKDFIDFIKYNFGEEAIHIVTASPEGAKIEEAKNQLLKREFKLNHPQIVHSGKESKALVINRLRKENEHVIFFDDAVHNHSEDLLKCIETFTVGIKQHHNELGELFPEGMDSIVEDIEDAYNRFKNTYITYIIENIQDTLKARTEDLFKDSDKDIKILLETIERYSLYTNKDIFFDFSNIHNIVKTHLKKLNDKVSCKEENDFILDFQENFTKISKYEESIGNFNKVSEAKSKRVVKQREM